VVPQITVEQLHERLQGGLPTLLVDVRQPWENDYAALPGSVLIPLMELPERAGELQPPEGAMVVVYCHHGVRSLSGASILEGLSAVSLAGGIDAWSLRIDPSIPRY
jgi:rhodanese-related sulfurtransferase